MKKIILTTVPDSGAAQVISEALREGNVEVETRRHSTVPYFATLSTEMFDIFVSEDQAELGRQLLSRLELESEDELIAQAMEHAPPADAKKSAGASLNGSSAVNGAAHRSGAISANDDAPVKRSTSVTKFTAAVVLFVLGFPLALIAVGSIVWHFITELRK